MRVIEKYKQVLVGIILIVIGVAWLSTANYDVPVWISCIIAGGLVAIGECEVEDG